MTQALVILTTIYRLKKTTFFTRIAAAHEKQPQCEDSTKATIYDPGIAVSMLQNIVITTYPQACSTSQI